MIRRFLTTRKSDYVTRHLKEHFGRQNEYIETKPKIPPPEEVNELIDSRDEYDDNPREVDDGKFGIWYGWIH